MGTQATSILLLLLLFDSSSSSPPTVCLHYQGCYQDDQLLLHHATTFHSYDTKRTAENCARLCLQRRPDTEVVLVKLEGVAELLSCSCGDDLTLGNHTGLTLDHLACYLCPDSEREKCGSDTTSSAYNIDRLGVETCENKLLTVPPPVTMPPTTTTTTANATEEPNEPVRPVKSSPVQRYHPGTGNSINTSLSHHPTQDAADSLTGVAALPHLRHLGCYDEGDVNETLVVTLVVSDAGGDGVLYCAGNCSCVHPAHADVFLLKVLTADLLYCGCGKRAALPSSGGDGNSAQCVLRCGEGRTVAPPPCGGFTAVSVYERSEAGLMARGGAGLVILGVLVNVLSVYILG